MKIKPIQKKQAKPKVFVVQTDEDEDLLDLPKPKEEIEVPTTIIKEDTTDDGEFKITWTERGKFQIPAREIAVKNLNPDQEYGIICYNPAFNLRICRPIKGVEIQNAWQSLHQYPTVTYFPGHSVRRGFRFLVLPNGVRHAIAFWPKSLASSHPNLRFFPPHHKVPLKKKPVKIKFGKPLPVIIKKGRR